jgi:tetraether lipid synthase
MPSSSKARADRDHTYWTLTTGACPACGRTVDAKIVLRAGRVYRQSVCPEHGVGEALVDEDAVRYLRAARGSDGARDPETIAETRGVCPVCRGLVPAAVIRTGGRILLRRDCPAHGPATGLVSSDAASYVDGLFRIKPGTVPFEVRTRVAEGCPKDCGLCPAHEQHTCLPIIEITERCDLDCPICLVGGGSGRAAPKDLSPAEFERILEGLIRSEGTLDLINLSGGEPTTHPRFRDIVALCERPEILRATVSTNGIRLADDDDLLDFLVGRGILISLQFDGFSRDIYPRLRGADILAAKERLLGKMEARRAPLSLVMTARRNASEEEFGPVLDYLFRHDHVVSLMVQPLSFTGRCRSSGVDPLDRLTTPDVVRLLAASSGGRLRTDDFSPLPCSHPACFSLTYVLKLADGGTLPLPRLVSVESYMDIVKNRALPGLEAGSFEKIKDCLYQIWSSSGAAPDSKKVLATVRRMFDEVCCPGEGFSPRQALAAGERWVKSIFIHHFMDEDNYDLARAVKCCNHYPLPDGRLMPACTYNVFYRPRPESARTSGKAPS